MTPVLSDKLNNLPDFPGVYQFKNDKGKVIYVGKARNLKHRVRSYFHSGVTAAKTLALVNKINDLELIVTDNEIEALVLENNLIKEYKPRYNVNLKDDKSYPYIKSVKILGTKANVSHDCTQIRPCQYLYTYLDAQSKERRNLFLQVITNHSIYLFNISC